MAKLKAQEYLIADVENGMHRYFSGVSPDAAIKQYLIETGSHDTEAVYNLEVYLVSSAIKKTVEINKPIKISITDRKEESND